MHDRPVIFAGLALFVAFAAYPLWHAAAARSTGAAPQVQLPAKEKTCVAPLQYMRTSHMKLLIDWRENAVRNNVLTYTAWNGKKYNVSLSQTCLGQCHTNKQEFCDRCHAYAAVSEAKSSPLYCFDCHVDPTAKTALPAAHLNATPPMEGVPQ